MTKPTQKKHLLPWILACLLSYSSGLRAGESPTPPNEIPASMAIIPKDPKQCETELVDLSQSPELELKIEALKRQIADRRTPLGRFVIGDPIHRETFSFPLSPETYEDLEIAEVVKPKIGASIQSSLGQKQLDWLVLHPSLQSNEVQSLQDAVEELIQRRELRQQIKKALYELKLRENGMKEVSQGNQSVPFAIISLVDKLRKQVLSNMKSLNEKAVDELEVKAQVASFQALFQAARVLNAPLRKSNSEFLNGIGGILAAVDDPEHVIQIRNTVLELSKSDASNVRALEMIRADLERISLFASALGELEVLTSIADFSDQPGMVPAYVINNDTSLPTLQIDDGHHLGFFGMEGSVANSVSLFTEIEESQRSNVIFLTGPKQSGRSTYLKMIGINTLLASLGSRVPATTMLFTPLMIFSARQKSELEDNREISYLTGSEKMRGHIELSKRVSRILPGIGALFLVDEIDNAPLSEGPFADEEATIHWMIHKGYFVVLAGHKGELTKLEGYLAGFKNFHTNDLNPSDKKFSIEPGRP